MQGAGGSWISRLCARGLLFLLAVGTLYVGYLACRLLLVPLVRFMVSLLNESLNNPWTPWIVLLVFFGAMSAPLVNLLRIGIKRALFRFVSEDDETYDETHDETSNEISDETIEAAMPKRAQRSPKRKRTKRS